MIKKKKKKKRQTTLKVFRVRCSIPCSLTYSRPTVTIASLMTSSHVF